LLLRLAQGPAPARLAQEQALVRVQAPEVPARVRVLAPRALEQVLEPAPVRAALELEQALVRQVLEPAQAPAREARVRVRALLAPGAAPEVPAAAAGKPGSSARLSVGNNERQAPS
jgi:hypothetical protein